MALMQMQQALTTAGPLAAAPLVQGGPITVQDPTSGKTYLVDLIGGQILELRVPTTITERLQAQQLLGIGMVANAQGRKATNEEPPKTETKGDKPGGRTTTTTSRK